MSLPSIVTASHPRSDFRKGTSHTSHCRNLISAIVLVKDSQRYIRRCLEALAPLPEILVIDTGCRDETLSIARQFENVRIIARTLEGFGELRNESARQARHDWILVIDSDEIVSPELMRALRQDDLDPKTVYQISIRNHYRGRWLKTCGWSPCLRKRLYHRSETAFGNQQIHESLEVRPGMKVATLPGHVEHFTIDSLSDAIDKMQAYSDLYVRQQLGKKTTSPASAAFHGVAAFLRCYFLRWGILSGYDGFVISLTNALGSYCKYAKLYEAEQSKE